MVLRNTFGMLVTYLQILLGAKFLISQPSEQLRMALRNTLVTCLLQSAAGEIFEIVRNLTTIVNDFSQNYLPKIRKLKYRIIGGDGDKILGGDTSPIPPGFAPLNYVLGNEHSVLSRVSRGTFCARQSEIYCVFVYRVCMYTLLCDVYPVCIVSSVCLYCVYLYLMASTVSVCTLYCVCEYYVLMCIVSVCKQYCLFCVYRHSTQYKHTIHTILTLHNLHEVQTLNTVHTDTLQTDTVHSIHRHSTHRHHVCIASVYTVAVLHSLYYIHLFLKCIITYLITYIIANGQLQML